MFIAVTYGMPYTTKEMPRNIDSVRRHEIVLRSWEQEHLFDSASHYRYVATGIPPITPLQRFLARTVYNPVVPFHAEWVRVGNFDRNDLIAAVQVGLDHDDDIIQQWFGAADILKLLNAANGWNEILLAVEAIGGGHEDTEEVAAYVKRILPNMG